MEQSAQHKDFDNKIRQAFQDSEQTPAGSTWETIEKGLIYKMVRKNKKRILVLQFAVAASFALILTLGALLIFRTTPTEPVQPVAQKETKKEPKVENIAPLTKDDSRTEDGATEENTPIDKSSLATSAPITTKAEKSATMSTVPKSNDTKIPSNDGFGTSENEVIRSGILITKQDEDINMIVMDTASEEVMNESVISAQMEDPKVVAADSMPSIDEIVLSDELNYDDAANDLVVNLGSPKSKWWIGSSFSPDYTYQYFSFVSAKQDVQSFSGVSNEIATIQEYDEATSPRLAFTAGFQFGYQLSDRWELRSGLLYADKGESSSSLLEDTSLGTGALTSSSVDPADNIFSATNARFNNAFDVNYKYEYFDIPLIVQYHLIRKKLNYFVSAGFSANLFWRNRVVTFTDDGRERDSRIGSNAPFRTFNFSTMVGTGLLYPFAENWSVSFEPTFRFAITPINKRGIVKGYPFSFGLASGLKFHF